MITQKPSQWGMTLIEVLISLLLISFILLGFDGMQLNILRATKKIFFAKIAASEKQAAFERERAKQNGFALLELLIAISVASLLIALLLQMYLASQKVFQIQQNLLAIISNADSLRSIFKNEIHQAGFIGCRKLDNNKLMSDGANGIIIKHANTATNELLANMQDNIHVNVTTKSHLQAGDWLVISNCKHMELFRAAKVTNSHDTQEIIATAPLQYNYEQFSEVSVFAIDHFYYAEAEKALFLEDSSHRKTKLLTGLQQFNLHYTVMQDNQVLDLPADEIRDWDEVVGVAIDAEFAAQEIKQMWHFYVAVNR